MLLYLQDRSLRRHLEVVRFLPLSLESRPTGKGRGAICSTVFIIFLQDIRVKHAVSISLGSVSRNKTVEVELLGERIRLERIGTDGDEKMARELFRDLDGKVDAFGIGGVELHINTPWKSYPLRSGLKLVQDVEKTPYTDGSGLKKVLEAQVMSYVDAELGDKLNPRKAFLVEGLSRYGMVESFINAGYECVFGDMMFALGLPFPIRSLGTLNFLA